MSGATTDPVRIMAELAELDQLSASLPQLLLREASKLAVVAARLRRHAQQGKPIDRGLEKLRQGVLRGVAQVELRRSYLPLLNYPDDLPVAQARSEIIAAIKQHQVVIVAGETGSGKTTQLPKMLLEAGIGARGMIGHTQPRRLAARTVAQRIADELQLPLGGIVGYQVRFHDQTTPQTIVKLMTDGILLAEIPHDRQLLGYEAIIIDEAHERSLNVDFLLGYLRQLLPQRPELKLIVTSATIDVARFASYFNNAPVIAVAGRSFPVEEVYLGSADDEDGNLADQVQQALTYIDQLEGEGGGHFGGDVLVFLPGEREIRECHNHLRRQHGERYELLPLYARLGATEQQRIFTPHAGGRRRVILATNVAETSVTVPGIRYVIDSGLARVSRYSVHSRVQRLPVEPVSRASANQRKGRCGRVAVGTCLRLYSEDNFNARPAYTDPEILRTNLASVILQMTHMGLGNVAEFPFLDMPDGRQVRNGYRNLEELGALDKNLRLTDIGRQLAALPVDPRLARVLLAAGKLGCLRELLAITSGLSIQDPRDYPAEKKPAAEQQHARFRQPGSDLQSWVALWDYLQGQHQERSRNQFGKLCKAEFISVRRVGEWRDLHRQLRLACRHLGLSENTEPASLATIHRAMLAGFLGQIGRREEGREYQGIRQRRFLLFPGSGLYKKPPQWVVSAEMMETSQLYARSNGWIEPDWVLDYASHLVKRSYSEPSWSIGRGQVLARETISLYGLVIRSDARINYGPIDPQLSREIFIRSALVEGGFKSKAPFWRHNKQLLEELAELDSKARTAAILPDDESLYQFYQQRIPADIYQQASFEKWLRRAERDNPHWLFLDRQQLLAHVGHYADGAQFPSHLVCADLRLPLSYRFEPGNVADGVSVDLPVAVLNRVPVALFDWLVPGLLQEKCCALVKTLPRHLRKNFVPVPDFINTLWPKLQFSDEPLSTSLARLIHAQTGVKIPPDSWQPDKLEPFYRMNARILDRDGRLVEQGRDIAELVARHRIALQLEIDQNTGSANDQIFRDWSFGTLAETKTLPQGKLNIRVFPALLDCGDGVQLCLQDSAADAHKLNRIGVARLALLALAHPAKYLRKELLKSNQQALHFSVLCERRSFVEDLLLAAFAHTVSDAGELPRTQQDFAERLEQQRSQIVPNASQLAEVMAQTLAFHYRVQQFLMKLDRKVWAYVLADVNSQLAGLLYEHFLLSTPWLYLQQYPRYLNGIVMRLEKLAGQQQKDAQATAQITACWQRLRDLRGENWMLPAHDSAADYRWLLEEFRISLFAQSLGTRVPVSVKRLDVLWQDTVNMAG